MGTADSEGIILDSNNFEGEINHIEIPHERKRQPDESLTEEDHSISRAELGKSMCVLRELRSRARFTTHRPPRELSQVENNRRFGREMGISENGKRNVFGKKENDSVDIPGFHNLHRGNKMALTR